LLSIVAIRR